MKKIYSIIRIITLLAMGVYGALLLIANEQDADLSKWALHVLFDKVLGGILLYFFFRLYNRFCRIDPWFRTFDRFNRKDVDRPNSIYLGKDN